MLSEPKNSRTDQKCMLIRRSIVIGCMEVRSLGDVRRVKNSNSNPFGLQEGCLSNSEVAFSHQ